MINAWWLAATFILGTWFGFFISALLFVNKRKGDE